MSFLRKFFAVLCLIFAFSASAPLAFAAETEVTGAPTDQAGDTGGTILPETRFTEISDCEIIMFHVNVDMEKVKEVVITREAALFDGFDVLVTANDILGCAIKTGDIKLWMVPFYIRYILEFIIGVAGLLVVGGIIYGGYLYLFGALTEQKEQGKKAIINSIIGLVLSLSAWAIVSIVIQFVSR
ncbi:hypothetical protein HY604_05410 [Candidatus Peregrinibacteria bacterium]|nr:hypothetical protein [Candidatus Peregrinibacteria bacterium]